MLWTYFTLFSSFSIVDIEQVNVSSEYSTSVSRFYLINHSFSMHPFSTPWKYQKTLRFSQRFCFLVWVILNKGWSERLLTKWGKRILESKAYSEPCLGWRLRWSPYRFWYSSKMKYFAKIVNGFYLLTIFVKHSILDVW